MTPEDSLTIFTEIIQKKLLNQQDKNLIIV